MHISSSIYEMPPLQMMCNFCQCHFTNVFLYSFMFNESDGILIFDVQKTCFQTNKNISMATCKSNRYCGNDDITFLIFFTNPIILPEVDCCYVC